MFGKSMYSWEVVSQSLLFICRRIKQLPGVVDVGIFGPKEKRSFFDISHYEKATIVIIMNNHIPYHLIALIKRAIDYHLDFGHDRDWDSSEPDDITNVTFDDLAEVFYSVPGFYELLATVSNIDLQLNVIVLPEKPSPEFLKKLIALSETSDFLSKLAYNFHRYIVIGTDSYCFDRYVVPWIKKQPNQTSIYKWVAGYVSLYQVAA